MPASTSAGVDAGAPIEVEITSLDAPAVLRPGRRLRPARDARRGAPTPRPAASRGHRPPLLPGDAPARGSDIAGHPGRDGQIAAALRTGRDARVGARRRRRGSRRPSLEGIRHDLRTRLRAGPARPPRANWRQGPTPDYRDHIVRQTARTRQRPAWMFPERLVPMTAVTSRAAWIPRVPLRAAALVALLLIALVGGAPRPGGPHPARLPAPFGPAANGRIAYAAGGDIFTVDPVTGAAIAIVSGPRWIARRSIARRDHIAFEQVEARVRTSSATRPRPPGR